LNLPSKAIALKIKNGCDQEYQKNSEFKNNEDEFQFKGI